MHEESKQNPTSMTALHLSTLSVHKWTKRMRMNQFTYIHGGITVACNKPVGYSSSLLHKPLPTCQSFTLFRKTEAPFPTNNFGKLYEADPKNPYRLAWADAVCILPKDYKRAAKETRKAMVVCSLITLSF
jgi:hypothetical protein